MTIQEVLWKLLSEAECPDGFPEPNNEERAAHAAPIIEKALRAAAAKACRQLGCYEGCCHLRDEEFLSGCVTAGIEAMTEES